MALTPPQRKAMEFLLGLLSSFAVVGVVGIIRSYGVDVPFHDDWSVFVPLLSELAAGELGLEDLTGLHAGHRIFFPRILGVGILAATGGDFRAVMFACPVVAFVAALGVFWLAARTYPGRLHGQWVWLLTGLLIFSPVHWHNWLKGFNVSLFLPGAMLAMALVVATSRWAMPIRTTLVLLACAVATFSNGTGVVLWPLVLPVLLLELRGPRQRIAALIAWVVAALVSAWLFLLNYETVRPASAEALFERPVAAVEFALIALGSPLASAFGERQAGPSLVLGTVLVLVFAMLCALSWRFARSEDGRRALLVWATLGALALASVVVVASGRLDVKSGGPESPRYVTLTVWLAVATVGLALDLCGRTARATGRRWPFFVEVLLALLLLVHYGCAWSTAGPELERTRDERLQGKASLAFFAVAGRSPGLALLHRNLHEWPERIKALNESGYLHPPLHTTLRLADIEADDRWSPGTIESPRVERGQVVLTGTARLPGLSEAPHALIVAAGPSLDEARVYTLVTPADLRGQPFELLGKDDRGGLRWLARIPKPPREPQYAVLSVWAYDARRGVAWPLAQ